MIALGLSIAVGEVYGIASGTGLVGLVLFLVVWMVTRKSQSALTKLRARRSLAGSQKRGRG